MTYILKIAETKVWDSKSSVLVVDVVDVVVVAVAVVVVDIFS
jgi:hypothetical protein